MKTSLWRPKNGQSFFLFWEGHFWTYFLGHPFLIIFGHPILWSPCCLVTMFNWHQSSKFKSPHVFFWPFKGPIGPFVWGIFRCLQGWSSTSARHHDHQQAPAENHGDEPLDQSGATIWDAGKTPLMCYRYSRIHLPTKIVVTALVFLFSTQIIRDEPSSPLM